MPLDEVITLRPALPADRALLEEWDRQAHVIASDPNDDWAWADELHRSPDWREQLMAEVDGRAVGFVQIIDPAREESHYWGNCPPNWRAIDIWIGKEGDLGRGFGTRIMRLALSRCFALPHVDTVLVDPLFGNKRAQRFYARLGFTAVERRQFGDDDCLVMAVRRARFEEG